MASRPDLADAVLAVGNVALELARIPMHAAERLPGMGRMAAEGAAVRARTRSRLEGLLDDVLGAPEVERAVDRVLAGALPDAIVRSLLEHHVVERLARRAGREVDVDAAVGGRARARDHAAVRRRGHRQPGLDRLLVQATDRALRGPELQRVIEHVAASPEVRAALTKQSTTLAGEMAQGLRTRAERARRRRRTHGPRMVATAAPSLSAEVAVRRHRHARHRARRRRGDRQR